MPRWKTTGQITNLRNDGEVFDPNWMNYSRVQDYMPAPTPWTEKHPPRVEQIEIWEVITEISGPVGVYAAWTPYAELFVVTNRWRIVEEFSGLNANSRLEQYLIKHRIPYPKA